MIQPSLAGLVPLGQGHPALGSAKRRTVLGYVQASLRDSRYRREKAQRYDNVPSGLILCCKSRSKMIQPSLTGLVPLVPDNPAVGSAKRRTVEFLHFSTNRGCKKSRRDG